MKTWMKALLRGLAAVVFTTGVILAPVAVVSCASTARTAYVAAGVVDTTADTAMKSWARFVVLNEKAGTPVPESAERQVEEGWKKYQKSVDAAKAAIREYLAIKHATSNADAGLDAVRAAEAEVGRASVALVHLIYQLKGGN